MDDKKLYRLVGIDLQLDEVSYPEGSTVELDTTTARALRPWLEFVSDVKPAEEPPKVEPPAPAPAEAEKASLEPGKEEPPAPTPTADEKPAQESDKETKAEQKEAPAKAKPGTKEGK